MISPSRPSSALDWTLHLALRTLACEHPELAEPERPYWLRPPPPMAAAAEALADQIDDLKQALSAYQKAVEIRCHNNPSEHLDEVSF